MARVKVKICGITSLSDAVAAAKSGADVLGFIFTASPRRIAARTAGEIIRLLPSSVLTAGIFMNQEHDYISETICRTGIDMIQLHGDESPSFCGRFRLPVIKRIHVNAGSTRAELEKSVHAYHVFAHLFDPGSGSGATFYWRMVKGLKTPRTMIAGGLGPHNVQTAVRTCRPWGIDVCSGVEHCPGIKDPEKMYHLMENVQ